LDIAFPVLVVERRRPELARAGWGPGEAGWAPGEQLIPTGM